MIDWYSYFKRISITELRMKYCKRQIVCQYFAHSCTKRYSHLNNGHIVDVFTFFKCKNIIVYLFLIYSTCFHIYLYFLILLYQYGKFLICGNLLDNKPDWDWEKRRLRRTKRKRGGGGAGWVVGQMLLCLKTVV